MHRLRILLVDDSPTDLELATAVFAEHHDVVQLATQNSARAALENLRSSSLELPDIVVLDVNMPVMSGLDLLKVMKSDPALEHLPVVMLSTSSSSVDVQQAYALHASAYLIKALTFTTFLQQVDDFLQYWRGVQLPRNQPGAVV